MESTLMLMRFSFNDSIGDTVNFQRMEHKNRRRKCWSVLGKI